MPTHNPKLPFAKPDWTGNPLATDGKFRNLYAKSERSFGELLRWQTGGNPQRAAKRADRWRIETQTADSFFEHSHDGFVWLGHATFLFRLAGKLILTDPVLGNCGPIKRLSALPIAPEKLRGLDYVLLSHNHRDHADKSSFQAALRQNPQAKVLTGLKTGRRLLQPWSPQAQIEEAGWWQQFDTCPELDILYLPAMHWARRGPFDLNDMLWGSYLLRRKSDGKTLFFGADSGYDTHFSELGAVFPGIDLALLGIGAYAPRWFMRTSHTDPDEAVQAMLDLGAKAMMPMHYGTFDLSDEPFGEPFSRISALAEQHPGRVNCYTPGMFIALN
jgi:L-ascorbate metabolism protein UlaG (beta-lactamase superfamily)